LILKSFSYRAILSYKGTSYYGWQKQPDVSTIQGTLENCLEKITKGVGPIFSIGSGRTDAGVHALGQVVRFDLPIKVPDSNLKHALNKLFPRTIQCLFLESCDSTFHPIAQATSKHYRYVLSNKITPFNSELVTFVECKNLQEIKKKFLSLWPLFEGPHSFENFYCQGTPTVSFERTIYKAWVSDGPWENCLSLEIIGNGFLKQMVRCLVGATLAVALEKMPLEKLEELLNRIEENNEKNFLLKRPYEVASPQGLYLVSVSYETSFSPL